jgi:3-hydroxyacyl-CoA dehydrogenase
MSDNHFFRKVAVLGAGVMGAQIAALLANANVETILFDLPAKEGPLNGIVDGALKRLSKLKPAPLATAATASVIQAANYEQDLAKLSECDLIIEAIAERLDWKEALYKKVAPYISDTAIFASNTSGLSIDTLTSVLPKQLQQRFCGVHFFNPPRYMKLVELIPSSHTEQNVLDRLETFLVSYLGKRVVHAKDTPNFIANRIGVFAMLAIFYHTEQFGLGLDDVDALTGPLLGRPKSATYRLADVVGLDTLAHVLNNMVENLQSDPWHAFYKMPDFITQLVEQGALGQKTGAGIYKKAGKVIEVYDVEAAAYRPAAGQVDKAVLAILKMKNPKEKFAALRDSDLPQAQFLWATLRDLLLYAAYHLSSIANNTRDVDLAMRWGFGWQLGPFETWQLADWQAVAGYIAEDVKAGKAMANVALPDWVMQLSAGPFNAEGAYSPIEKQFEARSQLSVYQKQLFPEKIVGERFANGEAVFESEAIRVWTLGDDVLIASFKTKANTINMGVLDGLMEAITLAETGYQGLVLWNPNGANFSYGADLTMLSEDVRQGDFDAVNAVLEKFQQVSMRLRYCMVPTVAAVKGMVLGGGCELALHCDRIVAAAETYMGLVEAGVGLLPAGGGTKEMARRAAMQAKHDDLDKYIADAFSVIAMAKVSSSAQEAREFGFLRESDIIIFNSDEILFAAQQHVLAMAAANYRPPLAELIPVAGIAGIANRKLILENMKEGNFISAYDYVIGENIAEVICGGQVDKNSMVDAAWLLRLEREHFITLTKNKKTQERIMHTLKTGKPLRN